MIRLDTTTRKLQIVLAVATATSNLPVIVSYSDKTATAYTGATQVSNSNGNTPVDICAAPASSTVRDVDYLSVENVDTASATTTIRFNDNGTVYKLMTATLAVGDQLTFTHADGWQTVDKNGNLKTVAVYPAIANVAITVLDNVFTIQDDGDTTKQIQFQASGITTGSTRTLTSPDQSGTIALLQNTLNAFANTTSTQLRGVITDPTGNGGGVVFANNPTLVSPTLGAASATSVNGNTFPGGTSNLATNELLQNSQSANYTAVLSDAGKQLLHPTADTTARTFTIPSNANVAYPTGTALVFVNEFNAGTLTIAISSDTLRWANNSNTGSRTLANNNLAVALKLTSTEWLITGSPGLT